MFIFDNLDSMILYHLILVLFGNIFFTVVGLLSQSRYAIIATARSLVQVISLDIFITIVYSLLVFSSQSVHFHDFVLTQNCYWFFFLYSPVASSFFIIFLLESKRTPFDHAETESEVVAGYGHPYGGYYGGHYGGHYGGYYGGYYGYPSLPKGVTPIGNQFPYWG